MSSTPLEIAEPRAAKGARVTTRNYSGKRMSWGKQLQLQALLLLIAFIVLFPILWVVSMSMDPRSDVIRPTGLNLIPPCILLGRLGDCFVVYGQVIQQPTTNPVSF